MLWLSSGLPPKTNAGTCRDVKILAGPGCDPLTNTRYSTPRFNWYDVAQLDLGN